MFCRDITTQILQYVLTDNIRAYHNLALVSHLWSTTAADIHRQICREHLEIHVDMVPYLAPKLAMKNFLSSPDDAETGMNSYFRDIFGDYGVDQNKSAYHRSHTIVYSIAIKNIDIAVEVTIIGNIVMYYTKPYCACRVPLLAASFMHGRLLIALGAESHWAMIKHLLPKFTPPGGLARAIL